MRILVLIVFWLFCSNMVHSQNGVYLEYKGLNKKTNQRSNTIKVKTQDGNTPHEETFSNGGSHTILRLSEKKGVEYIVNGNDTYFPDSLSWVINYLEK